MLYNSWENLNANVESMWNFIVSVYTGPLWPRWKSNSNPSFCDCSFLSSSYNLAEAKMICSYLHFHRQYTRCYCMLLIRRGITCHGVTCKNYKWFEPKLGSRTYVKRLNTWYTIRTSNQDMDCITIKILQPKTLFFPEHQNTFSSDKIFLFICPVCNTIMLGH